MHRPGPDQRLHQPGRRPVRVGRAHLRLRLLERLGPQGRLAHVEVGRLALRVGPDLPQRHQQVLGRATEYRNDQHPMISVPRAPRLAFDFVSPRLIAGRRSASGRPLSPRQSRLRIFV